MSQKGNITILIFPMTLLYLNINRLNRRRKKKGKRGPKRQFVFTGNLDSAISSLLLHNNIWQYADTWSLPKVDVEMLERQYPSVRETSQSSITDVLKAVKVYIVYDICFHSLIIF
jgi:hypothetical protein